MAMSKIKGLQQWCRKMAEGYPRVDIANFTTAWRDGLAFCAIIHRFRPDLIDFDSLSPDNVFENCKLAFEVAERELKIPAFLEAEDMARLKVPDKLSIITYVSQYYNYLHALPQLGGPGVKGKTSNKVVSGTKRPTESDVSQAPTSKKASFTENKENSTTDKVREEAGGDKCGICQNHVYLLERHMDGGKLYHRSCFRHSELSPANKVCTRSPFLSPSLSTDTTSSINSSAPMGGRDINYSKKVEDKARAAAVIAMSVSKKSEGAGSKHTLGEPEREDIKKSKLQPRALFSEENAKHVSALQNKTENFKTVSTDNQNSQSSLPLSSMEAEKLVRRQEDILASEKAKGETPKGAQRNIPLVFQQNRPTHEPSKVLSAPPTSKMASETTITSAPSTTSVPGNVMKSKYDALKVNNNAGTFSLSSHQKSVSGNVQYKDSEKTSGEVKLDAALSKPNAPPGVENLQKMFSGKSSFGSGEPADPARPVARPRSGTLKSVDEESSKAAVKAMSSELRNKDMTPKPAPRRSVLDTAETIKQPLILPENEKFISHTNLSKDHSGTSKSTGSFPPPLPKSAPPLSSLGPKGEVTQTDQKLIKLSEEINGGKAKMKTAEQISGKNNSANALVKQQTEVSSARTTEFKDTYKQSDTNISNKQTAKSSGGQIGTPLAGIRTTSISTLSSADLTSHSAAKTPVSSSSSKVQSDTSTTSSSKIQMNKATGAENTSTALASHLRSLADTSSSSKNSALNSQLQPSTEKSLVTQLHKDSVLAKGSASTSSSQTQNKVQESLQILNSQKSGVSSAALSVQNSSNKQTESEKLNSGSSKTTVSQSVAVSSKGTATSSLNLNQNSDVKLTSGFNVKNTEKKSENLNSRGYSKQISHPGLTSQSSRDESKNLATNKKDISSSTENINSIKLKRVMPERKEVDKEPRPVLYDVKDKLKKVDVIKGDTKWDVVSQAENVSENAPQKPSTSVKVSDTARHDNNAELNKYASGDGLGKKTPQLFLHPSSVVAPSESQSTNDIPQWKKDVEERKKKLKEDTVKSESETDQFKYFKGKDAKFVINSDTFLTTAKNETAYPTAKKETAYPTAKKETAYTTQDILEGLGSVPKKPGFTQSSGREEDSNKDKEPSKSHRKLSPTREKNQGNTHKLDWQLEAEKRMKAFAKIDFEAKEKSKEVDKSDRVGIKTEASSYAHETQKSQKSEDFSRTADRMDDRFARCSGDEVTGSVSIAVNKADSVGMKTDTRPKSTELKFMVNSTQLKPAEVNKNILSEKKTDNITSDQNHNRLVKNDRGDDFRNVLQHLKHVTTVEGGKVDDSTDVKCESVSNENTNKNNSNKYVAPEQGRVTDSAHIEKLPRKDHTPSKVKESVIDSEHIEKLSTKDYTPSKVKESVTDSEHIEKLSRNNHTPSKVKESTADENGNERKNNTFVSTMKKLISEKVNGMSETDVSKPSSPKVKRKITILKKTNKVTEELPPSTPSSLRKIPVAAKFNFEESTDLEQSLSDSTSRMAIHDLSHSSSNMVSPHISATELQQQLDEIDSKLTSLELRGRELEESIRKVNALEDDDDKLMIEWFSLVSEKNDLVRKEADLVYLSRGEYLESEQKQIETQLRYLMTKPDECKSPEEKEEEEYLLKRKVQLVAERNLIIDSMDEDRMRYEAEDRSIEGILRDKGYWKDSTGTLKALKGKKVARSVFYT